LVPTKELLLIHRILDCSDLVRKNPGDAMSGVVIAKEVFHDIAPIFHHEIPQGLTSISKIDNREPAQWGKLSLPKIIIPA
jgi:hypothetical protein